MRQVRHRRGSAVALVAAFVLVVQSVLAAWAASLPAQPMLDAFGNTLCITSVDHGGQAPATDHSKLPDCCMHGCSHAAHMLAGSPADGAGLLRPLASEDVRFRVPRTIHVESPDHDPGSPRAPPPTI